MAFALTRTPAPALAVVDGIPTTTSVDVARFFGKQHRNVVRDIENLVTQLPQGGVLNFEHTPLANEQNGETYTAYRITRDGFTLLAMGFTGKKALAFKLAYIEAFNRMEAQLQQPDTVAAALRTQAQSALAASSAVSTHMQRSVFDLLASGGAMDTLRGLPEDVRPLFHAAVGQLCAQAYPGIAAWAAGKLAYGCNLDHPDRRAERAQALLAELQFDDWLSDGESARARALLKFFELGGQMAAESVARLKGRVYGVGFVDKARSE